MASLLVVPLLGTIVMSAWWKATQALARTREDFPMTQSSPAAAPRREAWSPAMKRHQRRVWPTLAVYAAVLAGVMWLFQTHPPTGALKYVAAIAPAVPLLVVIWLFGRYLYEEKDEFRRWQQILALLLAVGVTLGVCIVWGFLEAFAGVAHVPLYHVATLFVVSQSLSALIVSMRYR
jgi:hypothetical protein